MSADTLPPPLVQRLQSYADDADAHGKVFVPLGTVTLREIIAALAAKPPDAGDASVDPAGSPSSAVQRPAGDDSAERSGSAVQRLAEATSHERLADALAEIVRLRLRLRLRLDDDPHFPVAQRPAKGDEASR